MVALPDPLNQLSSAPPPQLHSPNTIIGVGHRRRLACCPMFDKSLLAGASEAASPSSAPRAALSAAPSVSANVLILVEFVSTTGRGPCALRPYSQQQVFGFSVPAVRRGSLVNLAAPWLRSVLRQPVVAHRQFPSLRTSHPRAVERALSSSWFRSSTFPPLRRGLSRKRSARAGSALTHSRCHHHTLPRRRHTPLRNLTELQSD